MGSTSNEQAEVVAPRALIVPSNTASAALVVVPIGMVLISGAKLWVAVAANSWQLVTSV